MGKEKEFNDILDTCLDRLMFNGDTLEQCLGDYPQYADELKPLLEASLITSHITSLEPDQEFKTKARNELFTVLREAEEKSSRSFFRFGWQPRWASVVAVIIALLLASGGTAVASMNSMPDDFLYSVKRATEQVQLAFTFTNLGKAEAYARMADRRVEEIIYMANENDTDEIEVLASSLDSSLNNIAEYSNREVNADDTGSDEDVMMFSEKAAVTEQAEEADIGESVTGGGIPASDEDIASEEPVDEESAPSPSVVEPIEPEIDVELPPTGLTVESLESGQWLSEKEELNITVINQANTNIQRLYELLETVPESARQVILKAIQISERGYWKAIDSLNVK
ncbi:MAG: hypothetical protein JSU79_09615 [Dehalococcoidales bacterium]|nr:MAG: hypothetical protein JSU79_09615 [Dehalococcoidales bacterium]